MGTISAIWGILAFLGMFVGLVPCLGALNWLNIPFALVGLLVSAIAAGQSGGSSKSGAILGLVGCGAAAVIGIIRLIMGGGIL